MKKHIDSHEDWQESKHGTRDHALLAPCDGGTGRVKGNLLLWAKELVMALAKKL